MKIRYGVVAGILGVLCTAAFAIPGAERVYFNRLYEWPYVDLPVDQLRNDIEEGVTYALVSAGSTLAQPADRAKFSAQSVARDIVSRWNPFVTAATLAYANKTPNATIQSVAIEAGINLAPAILVTGAQEYFQLYLRNRFGIGEQKARWASLGIANAVLGSWQFWARPYIQQQLAQRFGGQAMSAGNGDLRRRLLEIDYGESFANHLRSAPPANYVGTQINNGKEIISFNGRGVSAWGTPYTWGVAVSNIVGTTLTTKTVVACKIFPSKAPICTTQYTL